MPSGTPSKLNLAMRFAKKFGPKIPADWTHEQAWDYLDQATAADLDRWQLERVVDAAIKARDKHLAATA